MTKQEKIANFDPSGVGIKNGHFIGLPFNEDDASIVLLPVPWDVTVSYADGTSTGSQNILEASSQMDLYDPDVKGAWKMGIYMRHIDLAWLHRNEELRPHADAIIESLENGENPISDPKLAAYLEEINNASIMLKTWIYEEAKSLMEKGKLVGVIGGEHSVPLGLMEAMAHFNDDFGVLQIDAHQDLRKAYEGFTYSHASIFYNALEIKEISKLVQVGIRDFCEEEMALVQRSNGRVQVWTDQKIKEAQFSGVTFQNICERIVADLPQKVYISFDIDGLIPELCKNTGTPVPGGLQFNEAIFLMKTVVESGRQIIGFDLCEVAGLGHEWDGNVGARILYKLCNLMGKSCGLAE